MPLYQREESMEKQSMSGNIISFLENATFWMEHFSVMMEIGLQMFYLG